MSCGTCGQRQAHVMEVVTATSLEDAEPATPTWVSLLAQLRQEFEQLQANNDAFVARGPEAEKGAGGHLAGDCRGPPLSTNAVSMPVSDRPEVGTEEEAIEDLEKHTKQLEHVKRSCQVSSDREFRTEFKRLCQDGRSSVSAEDIHGMRSQHTQRSTNGDDNALTAYKEALQMINTQIQESIPEGSIDPLSMEEMQLETYTELFRSKAWADPDCMPKEHQSSLEQICQVITNHTMMRDISEITDVDMHELWETPLLSRQEKLMPVMDSLSSALIMLNVVTLTLSLDVHSDWPGWQRIEFLFNICFVLEICMRVGIVGMRRHFCGHESAWSFFDLVVVVMGMLDAVLSASGAISASAPQINVVRILRLLRIAKMVRVLRLKMFKELRLIVAGLFGGLRTIFWGIVFLFFFILTLGNATKQILSGQPEEPYCDDLPWGCSDSLQHLQRYRSELFGNVPRCMFTIFRCFVADGCSSIDGTPLLPFLWDQYGIFICICYVLNFLFLTFGLFNLFMATIVESTMEAGQKDEAKRWHLNKKEHLKVALLVKDLVSALFAKEEEPIGYEATDAIKARLFGSQWWEADHSAVQVMLKSRVTTKEFLRMLETKRVRDLLEKLGLQTTDSSSYIDVFDANEDGTLSINELVRGLLKLRGKVDKADIIAGLMVTRDMQKSLKSVEAMLVRSGVGEEGAISKFSKLQSRSMNYID